MSAWPCLHVPVTVGREREAHTERDREKDIKILNEHSHTLLVEACTDIIAVKNNLEICLTVFKMHGLAF